MSQSVYLNKQSSSLSEFTSVTVYSPCPSSDVTHSKFCLQCQIRSVYPYLNWLCVFSVSQCVFMFFFPLDNLMSRSNDLSRVILSRVCTHLSSRLFVFP